MLSSEILKTIRRIEITTGRLVTEVFAGQYESVFKGRGMEFSEVREYQPGDDVRLIDWNVTARFGHPYIKKFVEERELTVMLLVDRSASGMFGTARRMKAEIAAEVCAVLAFSAMKNNDKVGLILFTDSIEKYIPPKKGRTHALRIIREALYGKPRGTGTDISAALKYLNDVVKKKCIVFVISDFIDRDYEKMLRITNKRHDMIAVEIADPGESRMPPAGLVSLQDAETGKTALVNTGDAALRGSFEKEALDRLNARHRFFGSINMDFVNLETGSSYVKPLTAFFRKRAKRFR
ncbi:DUF58 domain-containing protein [Candidatus Desantisbacteria bacterium CG_4_10_14_0_8_um_filter_48_22]|uniref:DUF58 domain-containing protein n=1 Tax=Candidatus Desantisbacteria bacterium CG_4_10_14_0_8_um_filter_48_22 TaxID=1974543 RepID=A0A2M7SBW5_9BACT|nr:MAG: hypothetical protein AUJ67_04785 [Candidatus Desantisbacteria bacterium CG1_02_49_89]PIV57115.1 MAG: DUF58 domain-containing protein [Candidatus Desantisbacteria bacterium CG02_land_8_20_14_3_00_49_13]PIZ17015.1 MAG: DUF58 domain-containing protein [Candidatus Desantisbacteria bacterium CG_4_10_14_0_8_um_filter_48_22]PJB27852.1 MAG: DUF58 domain-containing protein [Candidatus Desantisbacteria bacterium CG_4_9_14_3_um_filter_50_7]